MRVLVIIATVFTLLWGQGCTRTSQETAGLKRLPGVPPTEATEPPRSLAEQPSQTEPAANGGLTLRAAAPYAGTGTPTSQNVNPGPFLAAAQAQMGSGAAPAAAALTRSADGTMSGPNDLPPATTGWGTAAANYGSQTATATRSTSVKKAAKPK